MKVRYTEDWEAFQAVSSEKSFSKAAAKLSVSTPALSKRISRLEEQLKIRLFHRTTRSVTLTPEGRELVPLAERFLSDLREAESTFDRRATPSGAIRMTAHPGYAQRVLGKALAEFREKYPDIEIDLLLTDSIVNLVEAGLDLAVRIDAFDDSSLVARKVGVNRLVICASPSYLKNHASIREPKDLTKHDVLILDAHRELSFIGKDLTLDKVAARESFRSNDGAVLTQLAIHGAGVVVRSIWDVEPFIQSGQLKEILKSFPLENAGDISIVIPSRRHLSPRVRALVDFLALKIPKK